MEQQKAKKNKIMTLEEIRDRIAKLLNWDREGVDRFSLPTLQSFVRGKDRDLDRELAETINSGRHLFVKEEIPRKRRHDY
jgi:hypothetical protein